MQIKTIYITGFMGSGKSTIGKILARNLAYRFIDSDDEIEREYGKSIRKIFAEKGETWFRNYEESMIEKLSKSPEPQVISLGGGALMSQKTVQLVTSLGTLVYVKSSPDKIFNRIRHSRRRPLLTNDGKPFDKDSYRQKIVDLLEKREPGYSAAHLTFDRDHCEAEECAEQLAGQIVELEQK